MSRLCVRRGEESDENEKKKICFNHRWSAGRCCSSVECSAYFFFRKKISFFLLFCSFLFTARSRPKLFGGRASSRALWMCVLSSLASLFLWYIEPFTFKLFTFFFFSSSTWRPEQLSQKKSYWRNMREILKKIVFYVSSYLCDHGDFFELR